MGGTRAKKPAGKGAKAKRKSRRAARFQGATETTKRKQTSQPGRPKKRQKTAPTDLVGERAKKPTRRAEKPQNGTRNSSRKLDRPVTGKAKSGLPTQARKEKSHKAARKRDPEKEELIDKIVKKWESMRSRNVSKEERKRIAKEVLSAVSGWVPKLAMNHKGSRVLQHILKQGGEQEWRRIANEALPHVVHLAQSKHGSFLARKIASKSPRGSHKRVLRAIQGNVPRLARSATGCAVLEAAYARGSGYQRWQLVSELYGREFALFGPAGAKGSDPREAVRNDPGKRKQVVQSLAQSLFPALERGYVAFEFVHKALCDFLLNAGEKAVNEAAEQLDPRALPRMVHTREGVTCASIVYFAYSPKRRKAALKAFRPHVRDMCFDDCAHAFVMAALDVTDDTVALRDHVITPLFEGETGLLDLVCNAYGRRPLLHLVCPRSQRHFPPQVQFCLPKRTESEHGLTTPSTSQKDPDKRRREILGQPGGLASSLVSLCRSSPRALLSSKMGSDVLCEVCLGGEGDVVRECAGAEALHEALLAAAKASEEPPQGEGAGVGMLREHFFASRALRRLAKWSPRFVDAFYDEILKGRVYEWAASQHAAKVVASAAMNEGSSRSRSVREELAAWLGTDGAIDDWLSRFRIGSKPAFG